MSYPCSNPLGPKEFLIIGSYAMRIRCFQSRKKHVRNWVVPKVLGTCRVRRKGHHLTRVERARELGGQDQGPSPD